MRTTDENKQLSVLGVSFHDAPVDVRECLCFKQEAASSLLHEASVESPRLEALVVSTCNRTEFYLAALPGSGAEETWLARLRRARPDAPVLRSDCLRYRWLGPDAARHLFRVACGLESAVLGDVQILGQLKEGRSLAAQCGTLGPYLSRAVGEAIRVGKRARSESNISYGAASIGSAMASMLSTRRLPTSRGRVPTLLIIGAGKIARDIGRHAAKRNLGKIVFANRTDARAGEAARYCGAAWVSWSKLDEALSAADVVIAATAATEPILRRSRLEPLVRMRGNRPLLVVDAGMPRNVEPTSTVEVIDVDSIRERQQAVLSQRRAAIPSVERMIQEEVRSWERWHARRPVEAVIKALYQDAEAKSHEMAGQLAGSVTLGLEHSQAEQILLRSFKKLLHGHVRRLRSFPLTGEGAVSAGG